MEVAMFSTEQQGQFRSLCRVQRRTEKQAQNISKQTLNNVKTTHTGQQIRSFVLRSNSP
jgi:hypothetical protein